MVEKHRSTQRHGGKVIELEEVTFRRRLQEISADHIRWGRRMGHTDAMTQAPRPPVADWATDFDHTHPDYAATAPEVWDELRADIDPRFDPPHSTVQATVIHGGTAVNPFTGTHMASQQAYNPFTGRVTTHTQAYNPYSGQWANQFRVR